MPETKAWDKLERRDTGDRRVMQRSYGGLDRRSGIDRREYPDAWDTYWASRDDRISV